MIVARQFLVDHYLPTTEQKEKALWYATTEWAPEAAVIMKQYAVEAINELVDEMLANPSEQLSANDDLIQKANRIKRQIHGIVNQTNDGQEDKQ